jgi:hypothetical protein
LRVYRTRTDEKCDDKTSITKTGPGFHGAGLYTQTPRFPVI